MAVLVMPTQAVIAVEVVPSDSLVPCDPCVHRECPFPSLSVACPGIDLGDLRQIVQNAGQVAVGNLSLILSLICNQL